MASDELLIKFIMAIVWVRLSAPSSLAVAQSNFSNTLSIDRMAAGFSGLDFTDDVIEGISSVDPCTDGARLPVTLKLYKVFKYC